MNLHSLITSVPDSVKQFPIFSRLELLVDGYIQKYGELGNIEDDNELQPINRKIGIAISEFIDLVSYAVSKDEKMYYLNRLISMKSSENILNELESYLNIEFDKGIDPAGIPKTYYSPKLLKVTLESLTVSNFNVDFERVIKSMFDNLLYFLDYDMSINNLIFAITLDIKKSVIVYDIVPVKLIKIKSTFYL